MKDLERFDLNGCSIPELEELQERVADAIETTKAAKTRELVESLKKEADAHGVPFNQVIKQAQQSAGRERQPLPAKYRNPENPEQTWSGRGKKPGWVGEAIGRGQTLKDLEIA